MPASQQLNLVLPFTNKLPIIVAFSSEAARAAFTIFFAIPPKVVDTNPRSFPRGKYPKNGVSPG